MTKKFDQISDENIRAYLTAYAELDSYYILKGPYIESGLLCYVDCNGEANRLMEDNDSLVDACIAFLELRGNKVVFDKVSEDRLVTSLHGKPSKPSN